MGGRKISDFQFLNRVYFTELKLDQVTWPELFLSSYKKYVTSEMSTTTLIYAEHVYL